MNKYSLVVVNKSIDLAASKYGHWDKFLKVTYCVDNPSFAFLLTRRNVFYILRKTGKFKDFIKRALVKLLGKKFNYRAHIKCFLQSVNSGFKHLVVLHDDAMFSILKTHMVEELENNVAFFVWRQNWDKRNKLMNIYALLDKSIKHNNIVDRSFDGGIFLVNIMDEKEILFLKHKYPNYSNISLKLVDVTLKKLNPDKNLTENLIGSAESINIREKIKTIQRMGVSLYSYSKVESRFFDIGYEPNGVNFSSLRRNLKNNGYWVFVGNCEGERKNIIIDIVEKLCEANIKFKFVIGNLSLKDRNTLDTINKRHTGEIYYKWIDYEKTLEMARHANVIIDLFRRVIDEGYSYRLPEALAMNKKILTNRKTVHNEPFYNNFIHLYDPSDDVKTYIEFDRIANCKYIYDQIKAFDINTHNFTQYLSR